MTIKKIHYISGIILTLFIGLHLFNHLTSLAGIATHIEWMDRLRIIYRNVFSEIILLTAVIVQLVSGITQFIGTRKTACGFFEQVQRWTGLYMALFFLIHVGSVLSARYGSGIDTNFYFGAAGLNTFPLVFYFVPYYGLAILSFFGHIAAIHSIKMKAPLFGMPPLRQAQLILVAGIVVMLAIFYGQTNGFTGYDIPAEYRLIGK